MKRLKFFPLKIQQLENEQFKGLLWVFFFGQTVSLNKRHCHIFLGTGHFRVRKTLSFKMRLGAQPLL